MTRTRSLSGKQLQTPNHHSQNMVRGRPQSCRVNQIWTTTSWGSPPGHRLKAPSTGATGTRTLQPRLPKLRGLLRPKAHHTCSNQIQGTAAKSQAGRTYARATNEKEEDEETTRRVGRPCPRAGQIVRGPKQNGPQVKVNTVIPVPHPRCV